MSFVDLNNNGSGGQRLGAAPLSYSNSLAERPGARPTGSLITSSNAYGNNSNLNQLSDQLKLFQVNFTVYFYCCDFLHCFYVFILSRNNSAL